MDARFSGSSAIPLESPKAKRIDSLSDRLLIQIAGTMCAMLSSEPTLEITAEGSLRPFLVQEGEPDITMKVSLDDLSVQRNFGKLLFDSGSIWQLHQDEDGYTFRFQSSALGSVPYKIAKMARDFSRGEVLLHAPYFEKKQPLYPLGYPLDELLFLHFLALGKGALMHGCGVIDAKGRGHLFLGQSGAGKTTMARLWEGEPGVSILSDDRIILRRNDHQIWMYGTPWHGEAEFAASSGTPLDFVYFLGKGGRMKLLPQSKAASLARLFASSFPPIYNPEAVDFLMGFFEEIVTFVPCYELRFLPSKRAVRFIQRFHEGST